jgi:dUTP pyrophosphatase
MTSYLVKLKIVNNDPELIELYKESIVKMKTEEYKNNLHKDSGFDIFMPGGTKIERGTLLVDLGIQCACYKSIIGSTEVTPQAYYIYPRSSIYKSCIRLANNVGIIDSGYRGNLKAAFDNHLVGGNFSTVTGQRFLQICMPDLSPFSVEIVDELDSTVRGGGGFGSTGK